MHAELIDLVRQYLFGESGEPARQALAVVGDWLEEHSDERCGRVRAALVKGWASEVLDAMEPEVRAIDRQERERAAREAFERATTPRVGSYVVPDGWDFGSLLQPSDWDAAPFRLPSARYPTESWAVRVERTGTTLQRRQGGDFVRVRVVFVGDCEPDTEVRGWMRASPF